MKKCLTEFIGTFFLVLTIGCTVVGTASGVIPPLAIGLALMAVVYAGGHISGAHYNPAVTLGVWIRGELSTKDLLPYWLSQTAGALIAAVTVGYLKGNPTVAPLVLTTVGPALLAEFLFTFALVFVVLSVATVKATAGNSYFGLAIGATVLAGAFAVGGISGGAFNPAVVVGASVMGLLEWGNFAAYVIVQLIAGAAAATAFKVVN